MAALGRLPGAARAACRGSVSDAFVLRVSGAIAGPRRCSTATRRVATMASKAKFFVGGNWKCNGTQASVAQLVQDLNAGAPAANVDVVCAPTLLHLAYVQAHLAPRYQIAAQNCWQKGSGAYTGEVSAEMLKDAGVPWVILGHSERRALCGDTNEVVGAKTALALAQGVSVIACIGETLEQRNGGSMFTVLDAQMGAIAASVQDWGRVVLAYEPVWAIGTGARASRRGAARGRRRRRRPAARVPARRAAPAPPSPPLRLPAPAAAASPLF